MNTLRSSLASLIEVSRQAEKINLDNTDTRLLETQIPKEVLPLIRAVNAALDRLHHGFKIQREFTADAAHQLRIPIAILQACLALIPENEEVRSMKKDMRWIVRMIGQLLRIAEFDSLHIGEENKTADLHAVCVDVASALAPLTLAQQKRVEVRGGGCGVGTWRR